MQTGTYDLITSSSGLGTANFALASSTITVDGTTFNLSLGSSTSTNEVLTVSATTSSTVSTTYTLSASTASSKILVGTTTSVTSTITNSGSGTSDGLLYTGLGVTATSGTVNNTTTSGSLPQLASGTNSGQTFTGGVSGTATITPVVASGSNATIGGTASLTSTTTTSVSVYDAASPSYSGTGTGTYTLNNASDPGGLRSNLIVTSATLNSGVTQNGWTTALSGTITPGSGQTAASFNSGSKLNGTYSGQLVVSAENDQSISGAGTNDVLSSATESLSVSVSGNTSTGRGNISTADVLGGMAYGSTTASSTPTSHNGTSSGYGLAIDPSIAQFTNTGGTGINTTATLIGGTSSARTNVNMSFDTTSANGVTNAFRTSDILTLSGLNGNLANGGTVVTPKVVITDIFVLQLTYNTTSNGVEYIAWNNGTQFVNAIDGNDIGGINGNAPSPFGAGALNESYADYLASSPGALGNQLGAFGYYDGVAWAVLDHIGLSNGSSINAGTNECAVIPEPGTWGMILGGFGMLIGIQKLRRRRVGT